MSAAWKKSHGPVAGDRPDYGGGILPRAAPVWSRGGVPLTQGFPTVTPRAGGFTSNKFDTEPGIVQPLNAPSAFDIFLAGGKRDAEGDNIFKGKLIDAVSFNIGTAKADIFQAACVQPVRMVKNDLCRILFPFVKSSVIVVGKREIFFHFFPCSLICWNQEVSIVDDSVCLTGDPVPSV
ncbi:hypothetical protein [Desulfosarcina alkanivorans]|nr:hypothetical protein [Desulfosarcina alkanivorans]